MNRVRFVGSDHNFRLRGFSSLLCFFMRDVHLELDLVRIMVGPLYVGVNTSYYATTSNRAGSIHLSTLTGVGQLSDVLGCILTKPAL